MWVRDWSYEKLQQVNQSGIVFVIMVEQLGGKPLEAKEDLLHSFDSQHELFVKSGSCRFIGTALDLVTAQLFTDFLSPTSLGWFLHGLVGFLLQWIFFLGYPQNNNNNNTFKE